MNEPSIFTKIIRGEIPAYKIYEDEKTLAFLDIHPIQPGQVLVVPKVQVGFVWDMDDTDYHALMAVVKKVGNKLKEVFSNERRVGVMIEGLDIADHAHVKVFPFSHGDEYRSEPDMTSEPDHEALSKVAKKLAF